MNYKVVDPMRGDLLALQRAGLLYWWDSKKPNSYFKTVPYRLAHCRNDFSEECLRRWADKGELFTYEPD